MEVNGILCEVLTALKHLFSETLSQNMLSTVFIGTISLIESSFKLGNLALQHLLFDLQPVFFWHTGNGLFHVLGLFGINRGKGGRWYTTWMNSQRKVQHLWELKLYGKAVTLLNTLLDGQVISREFTARQWAHSTKDGNKLKIMRTLGIHNFTLCHHLSFVAHFLALYAPCQIKRTFCLVSLNLLWLVSRLSPFDHGALTNKVSTCHVHQLESSCEKWNTKPDKDK